MFAFVHMQLMAIVVSLFHFSVISFLLALINILRSVVTRNQVTTEDVPQMTAAVKK